MKFLRMAGTKRDIIVIPETDYEESCLIEKYGDPNGDYFFIGKLVVSPKSPLPSGKLALILSEIKDLEDLKTKRAQERKANRTPGEIAHEGL